MMESGFEASFPVVFFDGDSTMDMGNVFVDSSLDFKRFRSAISLKIGVSPHQITIYFERGPVPVRPPFSKVGGGRRVPVTNKFNFASILRETTCFFFVVSKRSRRVRRRKTKQTTVAANGINYPINSYDLVSYAANWSYSSPPMAESYYGGIDYLDYTNRMRELVIEKERYMMSLNLNSSVYSNLNLTSKLDSGSEITSEDATSSSSNLVCEICNSAETEGEAAPFHWCKRDAVVATNFRSKAGPIARPSRTRSDPSGI